MNDKLSALALAGVLWTGACAAANEEHSVRGGPDVPEPQLLNNADGAYAHWSGIGRLATARGNCTATLLDTRAPEEGASGPAYVLTNGHCVTLENGKIHRDVPMEGTLTFNYFADTAEAYSVIPLKQANWVSLQGVDMAIIELQSTLAELLDAGIEPLALVPKPPLGSDILVVGAPGGSTLTRAACTLEDASEVIEHPWVWRRMSKNRCPGIRAGSSGSPVLDPTGSGFFAVLGTTTRGGTEQRRCFAHSPCEVKGSLPYWSADSNYASQASFIQACFAQGRLDPQLPGCELLPGFALTRAGGPQKYRLKPFVDESGQTVAPTWNFAFPLNQPRYRYKIARRAAECEDPVGYSYTISSEGALIDEPIEPEPGLHMLCLLGVESAEQRSERGLMRNALTHAVELFQAGPTPEPVVGLAVLSGQHQITWTLDSPYIDLYRLKQGPADSTDCDDDTGYRDFPYVWPYAIPNEQLPRRFCTYAVDSNGQRSALRMDLFEAPPTP